MQLKLGDTIAQAKKKVKDMNPLEKEVHNFNRKIKNLQKLRDTLQAEDELREELQQYLMTHYYPLQNKEFQATIKLIQHTEAILLANNAESKLLEKLYHYAYYYIVSSEQEPEGEYERIIQYYILKHKSYSASTIEYQKTQNEFKHDYNTNCELKDITLEEMTTLFEAKEAEWELEDEADENEEDAYEDFTTEEEFFNDFFSSFKDNVFHPRENTKEGDDLKLDVDAIFKELVKRVHPDRAREDDDIEKRQLDMQRLNKARNTKDLYEMLMIRSEYLDETDRLLDVDVLKRYNSYLDGEMMKLKAKRNLKTWYNNALDYYSFSSMENLKEEATHEIKLMEKRVKKLQNQIKKIVTFEQASDYITKLYF